MAPLWWSTSFLSGRRNTHHPLPSSLPKFVCHPFSHLLPGMLTGQREKCEREIERESVCLRRNVIECERDREREREREDRTGQGTTDGRTDGQTDRRTDGQTDRRTDGQTDRRTDGQTNHNKSLKTSKLKQTLNKS